MAGPGRWNWGRDNYDPYYYMRGSDYKVKKTPENSMDMRGVDSKHLKDVISRKIWDLSHDEEPIEANIIMSYLDVKMWHYLCMSRSCSYSLSLFGDLGFQVDLIPNSSSENDVKLSAYISNKGTKASNFYSSRCAELKDKLCCYDKDDPNKKSLDKEKLKRIVDAIVSDKQYGGEVSADFILNVLNRYCLNHDIQYYGYKGVKTFFKNLGFNVNEYYVVCPKSKTEGLYVEKKNK